MSNGIDLTHADTPPPTPGALWLDVDQDMRKRWVANVLTALEFPGHVVTAAPTGQVTLALDRDPGPTARGTLLLDVEAALKERLDSALLVYLQPALDLNPLRKLRGVEVKDWTQE